MRLVLALSIISLTTASIYPPGETKQQWDARINRNIDRRHKRTVTVKMPLSKKWRGKKLKLLVRQTAQTFPLGMIIYNNIS